MVDFRKWLPAFVMIALFLGTGVMSYAQGPLTCAVSTGVPPLVRAEGEAELIGDIVLRCSGGTPVAAGQPVPGVNIAVFVNANMTNRKYGDTNATDALLLIDEPGAGTEKGCPPASTPATCGVTGTGTGVSYTNGVPNVWQGQYAGVGGSNYMSFPGVPIDAPGTNLIRTIRITNLRADVTGVGVGSSNIPGQVFGYVSITSPSSISIPSNNLVLGYVAHGLGFSVRNLVAPATGGKETDAINLLNCNGYDIKNGWNAALRFTEGFPSSLKRRAVGGVSDSIANSDGMFVSRPPLQLPIANPGVVWTPGPPAATVQDSPGQITFTESGYIPQPNNLPADAGAAKSGTRLLVRFGNLPANATIYASIYERTAYTQAALPAYANTALANPSYWSRVELTSADVDGSGSFSAPSTSTPDNLPAGYKVVKLSSGGTLTYEVVTDDPNVLETIDIPLIVVFKASSGVTPSDTLPTVNGSLAPVDISSDLGGHSWIPRFKENGTAGTFFTISPCSTNILFPWVVNQDGFDTGIAVANASQDPFGTKPQSGNCTVNYYGETTGGGAAPAAAKTTSPVNAGDVLRFVVSSGGTNGIAGTPGFLGYLIVQCDFQYAHGFAFITDGPIGQAHVAEGYLGLVLDKPGVYRSTNNSAESLNQ